MAIPILGLAARLAVKSVADSVGKKTASRAVGGIIGKGGKNVNPLYNTPSLAKTQAKGVAKLSIAGAATGALTQTPAVKESIKRQVEEANKNKKPKNIKKGK